MFVTGLHGPPVLQMLLLQVQESRQPPAFGCLGQLGPQSRTERTRSRPQLMARAGLDLKAC